MDIRSFEVQLVKRMASHIRDRVLTAYGLTAETASDVADSCPIQLPDGGLATPADYASLIGPPVRQRSVLLTNHPLAPQFLGLTEYAFVLPSWPHLFWAVHKIAEGRSTYIGFMNQYDLPASALNPAMFTPDHLTLPAIYQAALRYEWADGWDEQLVHHLDFGNDRYEGEFVWGLLQRWRKLS